MKRAMIVVVVLAMVGAISCANARRDEPFAPEVILDNARQVRGEQVFARHCAQCHPNGEAGLGPAINDRPVPKALIAAQIRAGVGEMPAFDESMMSSDDVDAVTEYLLALRRSPKPSR
jgi:mono/diheme cytochrome c family protein